VPLRVHTKIIFMIARLINCFLFFLLKESRVIHYYLALFSNTWYVTTKFVVFHVTAGCIVLQNISLAI
jgi:hypothetical protein